jgi:hypothetical protein
MKCKGKEFPLQAWNGSEVFRKLGFPDYITTAQDGGCQPYAPAAFNPQEMLLVLISVRG